MFWFLIRIPKSRPNSVLTIDSTTSDSASRRLSVPIPYARSLEQAVLPTRERIEAAVHDLLKA